jgi:hypothetical protein
LRFLPLTVEGSVPDVYKCSLTKPQEMARKWFFTKKRLHLSIEKNSFLK